MRLPRYLMLLALVVMAGLLVWLGLGLRGTRVTLATAARGPAAAVTDAAGIMSTTPRPAA